jgi:hypothetical protein
MQLTLAFLEALTAQPTLSDHLDGQARIEAVRILARIIAQVIIAADQNEKETTDE